MGAGLVKEERTSATQQSPGKKEGEELCLGRRTAGHCSSPDASFAHKPGDVEAGQGPWGSLCPHTHTWIPALPQSGVATDMDGLGPCVDWDALGSLSEARLPLWGWEAAVRVLGLKPATLWAPSPPPPTPPNLASRSLKPVYPQDAKDPSDSDEAGGQEARWDHSSPRTRRQELCRLQTGPGQHPS